MSEHHDHGHDHDHGHEKNAVTMERTGLQDHAAGIGNSSKAFGGSDAMVALLTRNEASWGSGPAAGGSGETVTYSFAGAGDGYVPMSATGRATVVDALRIIADVADISFRWADTGDMNTTNSQRGDIDIYSIPGTALYGSGGWNATGRQDGSFGITSGSIRVSGVDLSLYLHELMHALGVAHPGEYDGSNSSYEADAPFWDDSVQYTLMSYWQSDVTGGNYRSQDVQSLMLYDVAALQAMYGANTSTRTGDTVYGFNGNVLRSGTNEADDTWRLASANDDMVGSIWDAGGTDTLDLSGFASSSEIDLREQGFSSFGGLINNLSIASGAVIENAIGGGGADTIIGNSSANMIDGGGGADTIRAGGGADRILATIGDVVHGDGGTDIVEFEGFSRSQSGGFDWNAGSKLDALQGPVDMDSVEVLDLRDGTLLTGHAASVQRLYDTVFNRDVDESGLRTWTTQLDSGWTIEDVAGEFATAREFQLTYGSVDTVQFVTLLYNNVLDRAPDQEGLTYWSDRLESGELSRAGVVVGFSESAEHVTALSSSLASGSVWVGDPHAEAVARFYYATFQRAPDERGFENWLGAIEGGTSYTDVGASFAASTEFDLTYGALDTGGFIDLLYRNVLDRPAEPAGRANWVNAIDSGGQTRGDVLSGFAQSPEFTMLTDDRFDDGIVFA